MFSSNFPETLQDNLHSISPCFKCSGIFDRTIESSPGNASRADNQVGQRPKLACSRTNYLDNFLTDPSGASDWLYQPRAMSPEGKISVRTTEVSPLWRMELFAGQKISVQGRVQFLRVDRFFRNFKLQKSCMSILNPRAELHVLQNRNDNSPKRFIFNEPIYSYCFRNKLGQ